MTMTNRERIAEFLTTVNAAAGTTNTAIRAGTGIRHQTVYKLMHEPGGLVEAGAVKARMIGREWHYWPKP